MAKVNLSNFVTYDKITNQAYAGEFWLKFTQIVNAKLAIELVDKFGIANIPLTEINTYAQQNLIMNKPGQRWVLENFDSFPQVQQEKLNELLVEYNLVDTEALTDNQKPQYLLFFGGSNPNLFKRAAQLFLEIQNNPNLLNTIKGVLVLGNSNPYDKFMGTIEEIVRRYPEYFKSDITVPQQATMHEVMVFLLENMNWPEGKMPTLIKLGSDRTNSNMDDEAAKACEYIKTIAEQRDAKKPGMFSIQSPVRPISEPTLTAMSNQPFNIRHLFSLGIEAKKHKLTNGIDVIGASDDEFMLIKNLPAATANPAQIMDNLARLLYGITCNLEFLFDKTVEIEAESNAVFSV